MSLMLSEWIAFVLLRLEYSAALSRKGRGHSDCRWLRGSEASGSSAYGSKELVSRGFVVPKSLGPRFRGDGESFARVCLERVRGTSGKRVLASPALVILPRGIESGRSPLSAPAKSG